MTNSSAYETNPQEPWSFFEQEDPITDPGEEEPWQEIPDHEQAGGNIYHVYMVKEPKGPHEQEEEEEADHPIVMDEQEQHEQERPLSSPAESQRRRMRRVLFPLVLAALLVIGVLAGGAVAYFTQAPSASVTLIPSEQSVTLHTTIMVATAAGTTTQAIPGRALPIMTLSQATTVPTSGTGHQDAASAHGLLTFYNGLPQVQIVSAGTLLTSSSGIQVVTDEDAVIPAASLPTSGQVSVSAHALTLGPAGNMAASALSEPCCRENVYVQNSRAFTGGQLARSFPMVTKEDLTAATATLTGSLQQSVQAAMQPQIRSGETLISPLPCTAKVSSTHAIGEEAAQVTVSLDDTCHGVVYQTAVMQRLVTQRVEQEVRHQLGTGYSLSGAVRIVVMQVKQQRGADMLSMQVQASGACAYQFSQQQLEHFKRLMAGKSKEEAMHLLLEQRGVQTVSMEVKGRESETLPTEIGRIAVLVMTPVV